MSTPRKSRVRAGFAGSLSGKARKPPIDRTKIEVGALVYLMPATYTGGSSSVRRKREREYLRTIQAASLFVALSVVSHQDDEGEHSPWWFVAQQNGVLKDYFKTSLRVYAPATPTRLALCKLGRPDLAYRADWPEHLPKPWEEGVLSSLP